MLGYIIVGGIVISVVFPALQVGLNLAWRRLQPRLRGAAGESMVDRVFRKFKGKSFARVKDVMLPVQGKTSQIDNLLISPYGIFVIETKNYSGIIKGRERTPNWVQILPGSNRKPREFYNPIWQNEGHIRALKGLLARSYPKLLYHNIVVFSDKCQPPQIQGVETFSSLRKSLKEKMTGDPILTREDVASIKGIIERSNIKDLAKREEHIAHAQYTATMAKERERMEAVRQRAEEHREAATRVQNAYWTGRAALDGRNEKSEALSEDNVSLNEQIQSAASLVSAPSASTGTKETKISDPEL